MAGSRVRPDSSLRVHPHRRVSGLIGKIGDWVLATACRQIRAWFDMGFARCSIAVNFSIKQFYQKDLAQRIKETLEANNLTPNCLVVEVTESTMMEDIKNSYEYSQPNQGNGSPYRPRRFRYRLLLARIPEKLPVSHVKIDRSFIADIEASERDATLVKSIISMAHGMGLKVTAEGVENAEQAGCWKDYGCDEFQGFLFSKPVPAAEATALLETGREPLAAGGEGIARLLKFISCHKKRG